MGTKGQSRCSRRQRRRRCRRRKKQCRGRRSVPPGQPPGNRKAVAPAVGKQLRWFWRRSVPCWYAQGLIWHQAVAQTMKSIQWRRWKKGKLIFQRQGVLIQPGNCGSNGNTIEIKGDFMKMKQMLKRTLAFLTGIGCLTWTVSASGVDCGATQIQDLNQRGLNFSAVEQGGPVQIPRGENCRT